MGLILPHRYSGKLDVRQDNLNSSFQWSYSQLLTLKNKLYSSSAPPLPLLSLSLYSIIIFIRACQYNLISCRCDSIITMINWSSVSIIISTVKMLRYPFVAQKIISTKSKLIENFHYDQVIQPTPDLSPCGSEVGLYAGAVGNLMAGSSGRRAPLASMGSVDPPDPDSRSLGSDSVFLKNEDEEQCIDTEDEVSGFSTDSDAPGPSCRRFLRVPSKKKRTLDKWDGCAGCVPRRRAGSKPCQECLTISAAVETSRWILTCGFSSRERNKNFLHRIVVYSKAIKLCYGN